MMKKEEAKRTRGRPRVDVDLQDVIDLSADGNTSEDIARELGFSRATLFGRKDIREAYEIGRARMRVNLRHWQMEVAKSGNVQMLLWLGKQYLDQKDKQENVVEAKTGKLADLIDGLREPCDQELCEQIYGNVGEEIEL